MTFLGYTFSLYDINSAIRDNKHDKTARSNSNSHWLYQQFRKKGWTLTREFKGADINYGATPCQELVHGLSYYSACLSPEFPN
jgi:hypothetical protein